MIRSLFIIVLMSINLTSTSPCPSFFPLPFFHLQHEVIGSTLKRPWFKLPHTRKAKAIFVLALVCDHIARHRRAEVRDGGEIAISLPQTQWC